MGVLDVLARNAAMKQSPDTNHKKSRHTALDGLFRYASVLNFGEVHVKFDHNTGLKAIVAIHNLKRGSAIGGCRLIHYSNADAAFEDALRLGYTMSLKAAISNLNHGGAKAVLMKPKVIEDRKACMEAFADFVHDLGGRYITAEDSGTGPEDMDIIEKRTPFVVGTTSSGAGDPSPYTALGVKRGIEAAVKFKLDREDLHGIHVTIQGAGHVGYYLAKELHASGARLTMCDVNAKSLQRCVDEFGVNVCAPDVIYDVQADVFAPCALGAILRLDSIKRLRVAIVAGSANNQLAHQKHGMLLRERDILYAPDFVVNAGGLIYVAAVYDHVSIQQAKHQTNNLYQILTEIFTQSEEENLATNTVAEKIALERLR